MTYVYEEYPKYITILNSNGESVATIVQDEREEKALVGNKKSSKAVDLSLETKETKTITKKSDIEPVKSTDEEIILDIDGE